MLKTMETESTSEALHRHEQQLREFRDLQLDRARRLGQLADDLMEFVRFSLLQHQQQESVLQGRELVRQRSRLRQSLPRHGRDDGREGRQGLIDAGCGARSL